MKDLLNSVKAHLYERVSSPLFGAFVVSWLAWNHIYLLILCSSDSVEDKMQQASSLAFKDVWDVMLRGGLYPLLSAVAFILIYPHPAKWLFNYWHKRQRELKELRTKIEDETPMTLQEGRELRDAFLAVQSKYDELKKSNQELSKSQVKPAAVLFGHGGLGIPHGGEAKPLPDGAVLILKYLVAKHGQAFQSQILAALGGNPVLIEHWLDELKLRGFLSVEGILDGQRLANQYSLTELGRKFAVENHLVEAGKAT